MMKYKEFFKGKNITVMGLGLLGRGIKDAIFLAECGAELTVTDLKSEKELAPSLAKLKKFKSIKYFLGGHRFEDFSQKDFILKAAGVPMDSPYIAEARKNNIPVEMDASLFARLLASEHSDGGQAKHAPKGVTIVGITGTRGKTTTTSLIFEIMKATGKRVYLAGNIKDTATLPLLKKIKGGDFVVAELDSWQLQGFNDAKISPNVAVFTTFFDDHLIYYKGDRDRYFSDKEAIFKYQKVGDVLVVGEQAAARVGRARPPISTVIARVSDVPDDWQLRILGEHNRSNVACAIAVARALGISDAIIKKTVLNFRGVPGRLELVRTLHSVKIYNDTTATTPEATIAALRALGNELRSTNYACPVAKNSDFSATGELRPEEKRIILIMGGSDKGLDMSELVKEIPKYCKAVFLLPGTGTEKLGITKYELRSMGEEKLIIHNSKFIIHGTIAKNLNNAVSETMKFAQKDDIILFSPAFASFGMFKNEYDRGEQFNKIVKNL